MTTEAVEAGAELRVDYESGRSDYWRALGCEQPPETEWREVRHANPNPNPNPSPSPRPSLNLAGTLALAPETEWREVRRADPCTCARLGTPTQP